MPGTARWQEAKKSSPPKNLQPKSMPDLNPTKEKRQAPKPLPMSRDDGEFVQAVTWWLSMAEQLSTAEMGRHFYDKHKQLVALMKSI